MDFRFIINMALLVGGLFVAFRMIQGEYIQRKEVETSFKYMDQLRDISFSSYVRYPWIVSIRWGTEDWKHYCGGSIISERYRLDFDKIL